MVGLGPDPHLNPHLRGFSVEDCPRDVDRFDELIRVHAYKYSAHLFEGRGRWTHVNDLPTLAEALSAADKLGPRALVYAHARFSGTSVRTLIHRDGQHPYRPRTPRRPGPGV